MCWLSKQPQKTVEEIIARDSAGMTDEQKAAYWYELTQNIFALLGKVVDTPEFAISATDWIQVAQAQYPTLTEVKFADDWFYTTDLPSLELILKRDWSNLVPYVPRKSDCEDFATRLYNHLVDFYGITAIIPVWGDTDQGYHGFNLAVVKDNDSWIARLLEPQQDVIFIDQGPLGKYTPRAVAEELGIMKRIIQ